MDQYQYVLIRDISGRIVNWSERSATIDCIDGRLLNSIHSFGRQRTNAMGFIITTLLRSHSFNCWPKCSMFFPVWRRMVLQRSLRSYRDWDGITQGKGKRDRLWALYCPGDKRDFLCKTLGVQSCHTTIGYIDDEDELTPKGKAIEQCNTSWFFMPSHNMNPSWTRRSSCGQRTK